MNGTHRASIALIVMTLYGCGGGDPNQSEVMSPDPRVEERLPTPTLPGRPAPGLSSPPEERAVPGLARHDGTDAQMGSSKRSVESSHFGPTEDTTEVEPDGRSLPE